MMEMEVTEETTTKNKVNFKEDDDDLSPEEEGPEEEGPELSEDGSEYSDCDSELELDPQLMSTSQSSTGSDPSDSSEDDDVVFEHSLKHRSFFETVRKRRHRHILHRINGIVPALHFTGTHKTHFWNDYGVKTSERLPEGGLHGIDKMFTDDEFKKLGPIERRINVNGQKFKAMPNKAQTKTLYRSIANAVGMYGEEDYKRVQEGILAEILEQWPIYSREVIQYCMLGMKDHYVDPQGEARVILETYRKLTDKLNEPPSDLELTAAAMHYGFSYSIMDLEKQDTPISVQNCTNEAVEQNGTVKYHFLRFGLGSYLMCYEFLLPIGPLKKIQDGQYPALLRDVILVERSRPWKSSNANIDVPISRPTIGPLPVGFALDHRTFFHRSTVTHDLWSLLAELLYGKLVHAPRIKRKIVDSKHNFTLYYLACKAKKRFQVKGNPGMQRLADDFNERFCKEHPRGTVEDLAEAAAYFDFSYTLIGIDPRGNFYWTDRVSNEDSEEEGPYFAFFVKTMADRSMYWYALEDVGRYCPKEQKLYKDVQSGDLRAWGGKFYFYYVPRKLQDPVVRASLSTSKKSFTSQRLIQARQWASSSIGKVRASVTAFYSSTSQGVKNVYRSVINFFRWMLSRRKVKPDKTVQALFVRERP